MPQIDNPEWSDEKREYLYNLELAIMQKYPFCWV
jgi:hypothetical protein